MIPNQLKFRTKFIKATPEPKRACVKSFSRREISNVLPKEEGRSHMTMESVGPNNDAKFEFKQCIYEINEGRQCKRQAPKKSNFCSSHRNKTR